MLRIAIMNSKGGCGKTTIATNLASLYAARNFRTALCDHDPQHSSSTWLQLRNSRQDIPEHKRITAVAAYETPAANVTRSWQLRLPPDIQRVIMDTPAGLGQNALLQHMRNLDFILIPVLPSPLDIYATADFIKNLLITCKARAQGVHIGIVANRVRKNTRAFTSLRRFLDKLQIPLVTELRDTQNYLHATEDGLGIHELRSRTIYQDILHWHCLLEWIELTHLNAADRRTSATSTLESA